MKNNIHPNYQKVVFNDVAADTYFVIGSTIKTDRTIEYQGATYPYVPLDISSEKMDVSRNSLIVLAISEVNKESIRIFK